LTIIELVLSLAAILGAAILFTNAVEIMGDRLNLGAGAVGSVLAAVGTALPETMIPLVAIIGSVLLGSSGAAAGEIGIGAILGAPFLLATLAVFIVGAAALGYKGRRGRGARSRLIGRPPSPISGSSWSALSRPPPRASYPCLWC
jgi:cation:H+ antiporter